MTGHELLPVLRAWAEAGWMRRLDAAFARFVVEQCPGAAAPVVLAAALVAHVEGQGHSCLRIDDLLHDPAGLPGASPAAQDALCALMAAMPARLGDWLYALQGSPLVAHDESGAEGATAPGATPLVLRGPRLYLRRYWRYEQIVVECLRQRLGTAQAVDIGAARHWLDRLFPPLDPPALDWQKLACGLALRGRLTLVTGGPGTGKTTTAARLLALLFALDRAPQSLRVVLAAPTGKAAARLKQAIDAGLAGLPPGLMDTVPLLDLAARIGPARTLHALLGARPDTRRLRHDAFNPLEVDVVVVDEASMVHLEMMAALLQALPARARLVLLGDKDQLASVEAGAVLGDLCRDAEQGRYAPHTADYALAVTGQVLPAHTVSVTGGPALAQQTVMLRHSHRFGGPIGDLATAVNQGDAARAMALLQADPAGALHWLEAPSPAAVVRLAVDGRAGAEGGYIAYLQAMRQRPEGSDPGAFEAWVIRVLEGFDRFRLLCAVREGEWGAVGLNAAVERALVGAGWLLQRGEAYEGRPVMVTRNDPDLGVFNGDIGITLRPATPGAPLRVYFRVGAGLRSVAASRLPSVETAFAMTVHKSQGSEFEHTVLVLPKEPSRVLTRELAYTGVTRARRHFTLATGRSAALAAALAHRTRRAGGLLELLEALEAPDRGSAEQEPSAG